MILTYGLEVMGTVAMLQPRTDGAWTLKRFSERIFRSSQLSHGVRGMWATSGLKKSRFAQDDQPVI